MNLVDEIYDRLCELEQIDIHTHIDASHLSARGLYDVLLYHMVISELYSSGCPSGNRLADEPSEEEQRRRIVEAIPYISNIQNTSCFWGVRIILNELYGWNKPITLDNWIEIDSIIKEKHKDKDWPRQILKKAGIKKASTELWRKKDGSADDILYFSLEWAFFARSQWKQFDTALLELENSWTQKEPGEPLPVTLDSDSLKDIKRIQTLDDVLEHYCNCIPYGKVFSTAQHFSTDINYRYVTDDEMEAAMKRRSCAAEGERDIYANYIMEAFLKKLEKHGKEIIFQFSCGAEPLPYETGSKMRSNTLFQLADIFQRHSGIRFQAFLASNWQNQAICTLVRELPNFSVAGYWWHNFFPSTMRSIISERLDMLPTNKQIGFFSDAYCLDWCYAKSKIVRKQLAYVLAEKISQGQYDIDTALLIAKQILYDTPASFLNNKL